MANKFRALDPSLILTAAPQCPTDVSNFYLKDLITKAPLDILFIQVSNNVIPNRESLAVDAAEDNGFVLRWVFFSNFNLPFLVL